MIRRNNRLLITGSEGVIGNVLVKRLNNYDIIRLDIHPIKDNNYYQSDLNNLTDLISQSKAYLPINCIIHLAADSKVDASWESVLKNNIITTRNIFEFAKRKEINKIIFASSNHVTGFYEGNPPSLHLQEKYENLISPQMENRPDGYYGVSKIFGEALGRYYSDYYDLNVISLRIGTVLKDDNPLINSRFRSTWLSHDDLVNLIKCSLETNVKYGVYYGVSNNTRNYWDISNAKKELIFNPKDNAELFFK